MVTTDIGELAAAIAVKPTTMTLTSIPAVTLTLTVTEFREADDVAKVDRDEVEVLRFHFTAALYAIRIVIHQRRNPM